MKTQRTATMRSIICQKTQEYLATIYSDGKDANWKKILKVTLLLKLLSLQKQC
jgi:hypothetical protein